MTFEEIARRLDASDCPVEAAWAYEIALKRGTPSLNLFLDLAVLYFSCCDFGYAAHHKLSDEFSSMACSRSIEILNEAEREFGKNTELDFWRSYVAHITRGEIQPAEFYERLAATGKSLVPYLYLFANLRSKAHRRSAEQLLHEARKQNTARSRYIISVLESAFARDNRANPNNRQ